MGEGGEGCEGEIRMAAGGTPLPYSICLPLSHSSTLCVGQSVPPSLHLSSTHPLRRQFIIYPVVNRQIVI